MKRAGIFFFWEKDGVVDSYVEYYLKELKTVCDYLVVVINGDADEDGRSRLCIHADDVFSRKNTGMDATAYKDAIAYIGWEVLAEFDELIMCNATIFGPVYPLAEVFRNAESLECDFWGLTLVYENEDIKKAGEHEYKCGHRPDYIMSNFIVVRSRLLHSTEFRTHWENMPEIRTYADSSLFHEAYFTIDMVEAGFTYKTLDCAKQRGKAPTPSVSCAYEMCAEQHIPFIRRKAFFDPNIIMTDYGPDVPQRLLEYVDKNTGYDVYMIWENILRTTEQYDLCRWLNLYRVVPVYETNDNPKEHSIAVIFFVENPENADFCISCLKNYPENTAVRIISDTEEKTEELKKSLGFLNLKFSFAVSDTNESGIAMLSCAKDIVCSGEYEFICAYSDVESRQYKFGRQRELLLENARDNTAYNEIYIRNVIRTFEKEPKLGIALPPCPKFANNFISVGGNWENTLTANLTKKLLGQMNINIPISKPPLAAVSEAFWFRAEALRKLFEEDFIAEDFPPRGDDEEKPDFTARNSLIRLYALAAQGMGFYPVTVVNGVEAENELAKLTYDFHEYSSLLTSKDRRCRFAPSSDVQRRIIRNSYIQVSGQSNDGLFKRFARQCSPFGLWIFLKYCKCRRNGEPFVNDMLGTPVPKRYIKYFTPRFIWNGLKKIRCRISARGVYVEE